MDKRANTDIQEVIKKSSEASLEVVLEDLKDANHKRIIKRFIDEKIVSGLSLKTIVTQTKIIKYLFLFVDKTNPKDITRKNIEDFFIHLAKNGKKISTINSYKIVIKSFFRWLYKLKKGKYPKQVDWIERSKIKKEEMEVLTREEVLKLIESNVLLRDQCLTALIYDCGLRVGEAVSTKIKSLKPDKYGFKIKVDGKTGERTIRLVLAVPYIKKWLNEHPFKNNQEAPLFICLTRKYGEPLQSGGAYKVIQKAAKVSKIDKKIHPHCLRHAKMTHLAEEGFSEMELRIYAGWEKDSPMPATYLHQNEDSVEKKIRVLAGLDDYDAEKKEIEKQMKKVKPIKCGVCKEQNPPQSKFCFKCGTILAESGIKEIKDSKEQSKEIESLTKQLKKFEEEQKEKEKKQEELQKRMWEEIEKQKKRNERIEELDRQEQKLVKDLEESNSKK